MAQILAQLQQRLNSPWGWFETLVVLIVDLCVTAIFIAVFLNFLSARSAGRVREARKSPVATGTMILFFVVYYLLIHYRIGVAPLPAMSWRVPLVVIGLVVLVTGCVVNLLGRLRLGDNWANQVTLYAEQTLVTTGIYGVVRHPLYASLIWMYIGAALIYWNVAALLANLLIFIPMMTYRARQEEALLARQFPAYGAYQQRVGMFFPRMRGGRHADSL